MIQAQLKFLNYYLFMRLYSNKVIHKQPGSFCYIYTRITINKLFRKRNMPKDIHATTGKNILHMTTTNSTSLKD